MAPTSRLEEKLRKLGLSSDDCGSTRSTPASKTKYSFRIYFPQPPYGGVQFNALKSGAGYNFTGQLLGIGGKQLQRIKQESSARVEVVNAEGNLNGAHPDPLDPDLHAYIVADSLSKLHKAANMVWELLQPMNAKFLPLDIVPGGTARLTVAQQKASSRPLQQAAAHQSVKVVTSSKPESALSSQAPATSTVSAVPSASPALTPVTPAAQAGRPGSFSTNSSSVDGTPECSSRGGVSPASGDTATSEHTHSDSSTSSNVRSVIGSFDDFTLPPAAVLSAPKRLQGAAVSEASTSAAVDAAFACSKALVSTISDCGISSPEQQPMQPPTPGVTFGSESATQAIDQHQLEGSMNKSSCGITLPAELVQGLGTAVEKSSLKSAPCNTSVHTLLAACTGENSVPLKGGLQRVNQQPKQQQAAEPPPNSCSSCFQYGLGLCNSNSFDSSMSCGCTDNPALQALLADHQRQLDQLQQLQMQQQVVGSLGSSHCMYDPMAFQSPLIGSLGGSFEGDGFSLGPAALFQTSATMSRSQLGASCGFSSQPRQQLQEQQRMAALAASEGMVGSCEAPGMVTCEVGYGVEPAAAAGLSQSLPGSRLAVSTSMSHTFGSWGVTGELTHAPSMLQSSTPYGNVNLALADNAASPWMHPQSNLQQHHGMSAQRIYSQYGAGAPGSVYGMTSGFDQSGIPSSIW